MKYTKFLDKIPPISRNTFIAIYALFTLIAYNTAFIGKISGAIDVENIWDFTFIASYFIVVFALLFAMFSILMTHRAIKFTAILLLVINSSVAYFINAYNTPFDRDMIINIFKTDTQEASDLFSIKLVLYVIFLGILPSFVVFKAKIKKERLLIIGFLKNIGMSFAVLAIALALVFASYRKISLLTRANNEVFHYLVPSNYIGASFKVVKSKFRKQKPLQQIALDAKFDKTQNTLLILIVGETARVANFSAYNYQRKTNPLLEKEAIHALPNTTSCGTSTAVSLPCMFSHLSRSNFLSNKENYEFFPAFLQRLGVNVLYKDNNFGGCKGTCDGVESVNTQKLNNPKFCRDGQCIDGILLEGLDDWISKHKNAPSMIVLHQNGSHGPRYNKRYSAEFEKFKPVCDNPNVAECSQEEIINAYDNTILYTDHRIHSAIQLAKRQNRDAYVVYVSDHGESLGENGMYLHGFPYKVAPDFQKQIPFILWSSRNVQIHKATEHSHQNLFHTVLGIFNVETELYDAKLDVMNDKT